MSFVKDAWDNTKDSFDDAWGGVQEGWDDIRGETAAQAGKEAAAQELELQQQGMSENVEFQREALDYLKEQEELPSQIREGGLSGLGALFGVPGVEGQSKADFVAGIESDPFYQQQLKAAEESLLRNASATGSLRSGQTQAGLATIAPQLQQNIYNQHLAGLEGLAGIGSGAGQIAQQTSNIGNVINQGYNQLGATTSAGILGPAQAKQAGLGNVLNAGLTAGALFAAFSDPILKDDVKVIGKVSGMDWCEWSWNEQAKKLGLEGKAQGFMADEVERKYPDSCGVKDGYRFVNYAEILQ